MELHADLTAVRAADDEEPAHRARIQAKRLRYLLEPLLAEAESSKPIVKRLKHLQQVLGDLHDAHVLAAELATALEVAAAEKARRLHDLTLREDTAAPRLRSELRQDERPGLLGLARLVRERRQQLFAALHAGWLEQRAEPFLQEVSAFAAELAARSGRHRTQTFLLRAVPGTAQTTACSEIELGWLPGGKLQERLRRTRTEGSEQFHRVLDMGEDGRQIGFEEEIAAEHFEALWPLTTGRRCRLRRYLLADGSATWQIDEFLDRDLVLARVGREMVPSEWPAWLRAFYLREVTDEAEFAEPAVYAEISVPAQP
jgi:CYTH domain-containing protein